MLRCSESRQECKLDIAVDGDALTGLYIAAQTIQSRNFSDMSRLTVANSVVPVRRFPCEAAQSAVVALRFSGNQSAFFPAT